MTSFITFVRVLASYKGMKKVTFKPTEEISDSQLQALAGGIFYQEVALTIFLFSPMSMVPNYVRILVKQKEIKGNHQIPNMLMGVILTTSN